jgi:hypothetical protein
MCFCAANRIEQSARIPTLPNYAGQRFFRNTELVLHVPADDRWGLVVVTINGVPVDNEMPRFSLGDARHPFFTELLEQRPDVAL